MARAIADIEKDIRALSADEKRELLRSLLRDLDGPADADVEKAWLVESQRVFPADYRCARADAAQRAYREKAARRSRA